MEGGPDTELQFVGLLRELGGVVEESVQGFGLRVLPLHETVSGAGTGDVRAVGEATGERPVQAVRNDADEK